jgi:hypothetical protein
MVGRSLDLLLSEQASNLYPPVTTSNGSDSDDPGRREAHAVLRSSTTEKHGRSAGSVSINIGVLIGKGEFPREQSLETAETIAGVVRPPSRTVSAVPDQRRSSGRRLGVKTSARERPPGRSARTAQPAAGHNTQAKVTRHAPERSIPVIDEASIALARSHEGCIADFLLLDSHRGSDRRLGRSA